MTKKEQHDYVSRCLLTSISSKLIVNTDIRLVSYCNNVIHCLS